MAEHALTYFSFLLAAAAAIRIYSKDLDEDFSQEARDALALRLMCLSGSESSYLYWVNQVFDRIFGKRHLSMRCFLMSSFISAVCFTAIFVWVASVQPGFNFTAGMLTGLPVLVLIVGILVNVPSDYIALMETRWIMRSRLRTPWKIVADFVLTYLISLGWLALLLSLFLGPKIGFMTYWVVALDPIAVGAAIDYSNPTDSAEGLIATAFLDALIFYVFLARVVLGTSYITSIWVWISGFADFFIRFLFRYQKAVDYLNIEEKPIRSLGLMISIFLFLAGAAAYPLFFAVLS